MRTLKTMAYRYDALPRSHKVLLQLWEEYLHVWQRVARYPGVRPIKHGRARLNRCERHMSLAEKRCRITADALVQQVYLY